MSCLLTARVNGCRRDPVPPARMIPFISHFLVGPHPHSLMPGPLRASALVGGHGRRRFSLSRGAPPPLADAWPAARFGACGRAWPQALLTFSWGPTPTRCCLCGLCASVVSVPLCLCASVPLCLSAHHSSVISVAPVASVLPPSCSS